jgi:4-amino-4-deoxy-L-arabinose transferase-like glycosyltransferase
VYLLSKFDEDFKGKTGFLKKFWNENKISMIFLILLTAIVAVITYYRIMVQIEIGPISDSFDFLSNALVYAGQGMGYADLLRPPFFGFLISLVFRMGYISSAVISYMDGIMFILGVIGLYILLKIRFNDLESFLGSLLYATFPIVLLFLGVGFSDLASVSITIWAFYFTVLAVKKDSRFFLLSLPIFMLAFLTRYNNALLIFPIFLYILINKDKINFKQFFSGIGVSFLIIVPVLLFFYQKFGNIIYPFINFGFTSTSTALTSSAESFAYNPNVLYFIQNAPVLIGPQGIFILFIILFGVLVFGMLHLFKRDWKNDIKVKLDLNNKITQIKLVILFLTIILFLATFGKIFYMVNEVLFFIIAYLSYDLTRNFNLKNFNLSLMFFSWLMVFFIFNSIYVIKDVRYFVLMAPPIAYFMILGLSEISARINIKYKNRNVVFPILTLLLTTIMLLSAASQISDMPNTYKNKVILNGEINQSSQWFMDYDPSYKTQNIYSDLWPNYSWYLQTNVKMVPAFKDNQTFANGVKDETFNQVDSDQFNNYLITNNADYYICLREGLNLKSYTVIKQIGDVTIYKKNT